MQSCGENFLSQLRGHQPLLLLCWQLRADAAGTAQPAPIVTSAGLERNSLQVGLPHLCGETEQAEIGGA